MSVGATAGRDGVLIGEAPPGVADAAARGRMPRGRAGRREAGSWFVNVPDPGYRVWPPRCTGSAAHGTGCAAHGTDCAARSRPTSSSSFIGPQIGRAHV